MSKASKNDVLVNFLVIGISCFAGIGLFPEGRMKDAIQTIIYISFGVVGAVIVKFIMAFSDKKSEMKNSQQLTEEEEEEEEVFPKLPLKVDSNYMSHLNIQSQKSFCNVGYCGSNRGLKLPFRFAYIAPKGEVILYISKENVTLDNIKNEIWMKFKKNLQPNMDPGSVVRELHEWLY